MFVSNNKPINEILPEEFKSLHNRLGDIDLNQYLKKHHNVDLSMISLYFEDGFLLNNNENLNCYAAIVDDESITILRDVHIEINPLIFFPKEINGIRIGMLNCKDVRDTLSIFDEKFIVLKINKVIISTKKDSDQLFYSFEKIKYNNLKVDELGKLSYDFENLNKLTNIKLLKSISNSQYSFKGSLFSAPKANVKEADCILFAQEGNSFDPNAIRVLRWFPATKKEQIKHDGFYEYGYIAKSENSVLHKFMTEKGSRILFAKLSNCKIKVIGGIEVFVGNGKFKEYIFPSCLVKYI